MEAGGRRMIGPKICFTLMNRRRKTETDTQRQREERKENIKSNKKTNLQFQGGQNRKADFLCIIR